MKTILIDNPSLKCLEYARKCKLNKENALDKVKKEFKEGKYDSIFNKI